MEYQLICSAYASGGVNWAYGQDDNLPDQFQIIYNLHKAPMASNLAMAKEHVESLVRFVPIPWIRILGTRWFVDLDAIKERHRPFQGIEWLVGNVEVMPRFDPQVSGANQNSPGYFPRLVMTVSKESKQAINLGLPPPLAIADSLLRFSAEHPNPATTGFIIMRFGSTHAHSQITESIRSSLGDLGLEAVRADDREYHDDLFHNILTYIYGCGFGVAVFERIEMEETSPNVALEVGYMMALGRPICLLKDRTLSTLPSDLVGKLYRVFDPQDPKNTIGKILKDWCRHKGIQNHSDIPIWGW